jgi:hypothetical protein
MSSRGKKEQVYDPPASLVGGRNVSPYPYGHVVCTVTGAVEPPFDGGLLFG